MTTTDRTDKVLSTVRTVALALAVGLGGTTAIGQSDMDSNLAVVLNDHADKLDQCCAQWPAEPVRPGGPAQDVPPPLAPPPSEPDATDSGGDEAPEDVPEGQPDSPPSPPEDPPAKAARWPR